MLRTRVIPCLLLEDGGLVKTIQFKNSNYIGDPMNAVRIFNELEVDELVFLDIRASKNGTGPDFKLVAEISSQCFMPLSYGGGVRSLAEVEKLLSLGVEKVCVNSVLAENPGLVTEVARRVGSQSIVASIDAKKSWLGKYQVVVPTGKPVEMSDPVEYARWVESLGAGEIFLNSIDRDGVMDGYDIALIKRVTEAVKIPVIACGGAGKLNDLGLAVREGGASAVAAGSLFVYQNKNRSVLINFPTPVEVASVLK